MFADKEQAIIKVLQENPQVSLERAYQHVVYPQFQGKIKTLSETQELNRAKMREEILKEIKARPGSPSAVPSPPVPRPEDTADSPKDSRSIIAAAVAGLKNR